MGNEITVTLPLNEYNRLLKDAEHNHVKNFIHKRYTDFDKNIYTVAVDQEAVQSRFGNTVHNIDFGIQQENMKLRDTLIAISNISNHAGAMTIEEQLNAVIEQAKHGLRFN